MKRNTATSGAKSLVSRYVLRLGCNKPFLEQKLSACDPELFALQWPQQLNASLEEVDPDLYDIIEKEKNRQYKVLYALGCNFSLCLAGNPFTYILLTILLWQTSQTSLQLLVCFCYSAVCKTDAAWRSRIISLAQYLQL